VYPIDGAAYVPAENGKENMIVSRISVCQSWGVFEFGCAGKHRSYAFKFHAPGKLLS